MQTSIHVFSKRFGSLRDKVLKDSKLSDFGLTVKEEKRSSRSPGWSKIEMENGPGVINLEWHRSSQTLICRIVTRGTDPQLIAGAFVSFLLARLSKQIASIYIRP